MKLNAKYNQKHNKHKQTWLTLNKKYKDKLNTIHVSLLFACFLDLLTKNRM